MRILAVMMSALLVLSSTMWAAGPVLIGRVQTIGLVLTNSIPMPDGGTVRSGDSISTRQNALALITSPTYGRLEVRSDSEARLAADRAKLERGAVASDRLPIEVNGYTVRPQNGNPAWFAVANRGGRLVVAAHRGSVIIASAGEPPVVVQEGSVAQQEQDQQKNQNQPPEQEKGKRKRSAAAAAGGGWTIGSLSHAASVALLVGVGAAVAATAAGFAISLNDEAPSPSR